MVLFGLHMSEFRLCASKGVEGMLNQNPFRVCCHSTIYLLINWEYSFSFWYELIHKYVCDCVDVLNYLTTESILKVAM
jgi:hypothetical protein